MSDLQPTVSEATPINRILAGRRRRSPTAVTKRTIPAAGHPPGAVVAWSGSPRCAALAGDPVERLASSRARLRAEPDGHPRQDLAGRARVQVINQLTEQGIAAVRDKNMGGARQHFAEIVRLDPTHEVTRLRLAALAESPEEQVA